MKSKHTQALKTLQSLRDSTSRPHRRSHTKPHITPNKECRVLSLYKSGRSSLQIQRLCNISNSSVFRILKRNGIATRSISAARGGLDKTQTSVMCRRYSQGESSKQLAKEFGLAVSTVVRVLAREGVERREAGSVHDTVEQALRSQHNFRTPRTTYLYVYSLRRFPTLLKLGISFEPLNRAADKEYGELVLGYEFATRHEAHFLEEAALKETLEFAYCPPGMRDKWPGWTELRKLDRDTLRIVIETLRHQLTRLGLWGFAACFVPMTPGQRRRCLAKADNRDECRATLTTTSRTEEWNRGWRHLKEYLSANGNRLPPRSYRTGDGFYLGAWVRNQRELREFLSEERTKSLESLSGWSWSVRKSDWSERFRLLSEIAAATGSASLKSDFTTKNGVRLGAWAGNNRSRRALLTAEQVRLLESLPGWTWDPRQTLWESGFRQLCEYVRQCGTAAVTHSYRTQDGFRLGYWVLTQRQRQRKRTLDHNHKKRLESLPDWSWDRRDNNWTLAFRSLHHYARVHGSAIPPRHYTTANGFRLGLWVSNVRRRRQKLPRNRRRQLESLPGWKWPE